MRVLIFEHAFKVTGHRLGYASQVAAAVQGHDVVVALPEVLRQEPLVAEYFGPVARHHYAATSPGSFWKYARQSLSCLQQSIHELQPDHVLIPTADGLATWAGLRQCLGGAGLGRTPIDICLMTGRRPAADLTGLRRWGSELKWWLLQRGPWKHVLMMDPRSWSELPRRQRLRLAPDPVPPRPPLNRRQAREALGLPTEGRLMVSAGNQDQRKGVDRLLAGFCQSDWQPQDRLLLIGRFSDEVRHQWKALSDLPQAGQVIIRDQFVSDTEFAQALMAANLVVTPYRDTVRPSGVVSRALAWGIPIAAPDSGWLGWALNRLEAGFPLDVSGPDKLGASLARALDRAEQFSPGARCQDFARFNSQAGYRELWRCLIEDPQHLPDAPEFLHRV